MENEVIRRLTILRIFLFCAVMINIHGQFKIKRTEISEYKVVHGVDFPRKSDGYFQLTPQTNYVNLNEPLQDSLHPFNM